MKILSKSTLRYNEKLDFHNYNPGRQSCPSLETTLPEINTIVPEEEIKQVFLVIE